MQLVTRIARAILIFTRRLAPFSQSLPLALSLHALSHPPVHRSTPSHPNHRFPRDPPRGWESIWIRPRSALVAESFHATTRNSRPREGWRRQRTCPCAKPEVRASSPPFLQPRRVTARITSFPARLSENGDGDRIEARSRYISGGGYLSLPFARETRARRVSRGAKASVGGVFRFENLLNSAENISIAETNAGNSRLKN